MKIGEIQNQITWEMKTVWRWIPMENGMTFLVPTVTLASSVKKVMVLLLL